MLIAPLWTPVFYDVISNSSAIILSARLRSSNLQPFLCFLLVHDSCRVTCFTDCKYVYFPKSSLYHVAIPTDVSLLSLSRRQEAKPRGGSATYDKIVRGLLEVFRRNLSV